MQKNINVTIEVSFQYRLSGRALGRCDISIPSARNRSQIKIQKMKQKREAQQNYDSIHQSIQSSDLATKEKAIKDVQAAKSHLAQFQNHTYNPTNTLKIAQEKLNFLKSKKHI